MDFSKILTLAYFTIGGGYALAIWQQDSFLKALLWVALLIGVNFFVRFLALKTLTFYDKKNPSTDEYIVYSGQIPSYWDTIFNIYAIVQILIMFIIGFLAFYPK